MTRADAAATRQAMGALAPRVERLMRHVRAAAGCVILVSPLAPPAALAQDAILDGLRRGEYRFGPSAYRPFPRLSLAFGPVLQLEATRRDHTALRHIAKRDRRLAFEVETSNEAERVPCRWRVTIERVE